MYNKGAYNIYYCMDMTNNIISLFVCFFISGEAKNQCLFKTGLV